MADINEPILIAAQIHSNNNHQLLVDEGGECGCFHCLQTFDATEVHEWVNGGETALCPRCHIDSVLSSKVFPIDSSFLRRMRARWFERFEKLDLTAEFEKLRPKAAE